MIRVKAKTSNQSPQESPKIGTLNEKPLHAALKEWYAQPGDRFEVPVDGYVVDILRGDLLVEIQTGGFSSLKRKLAVLTQGHRVRLVYPVAREKWLLKMPPNGHGPARRRKSPKRGSFEDVFNELVSFPALLANSHFSVEVLLIQEEETRRYEGGRRWRRRGWVVESRDLLRVVGRRLFETPADMVALLPGDLSEPFATGDLAVAIGRPRRLAQRMAYCLREMGAIEVVGKRRSAFLYARVGPPKEPGL